ncbi:MAG: hypothetical protein M1816_004201 [Peltula sp. TS41687]|nr:MAG: hypothetical protein M1816_004201 [Peltula sp. TS41687]
MLGSIWLLDLETWDTRAHQAARRLSVFHAETRSGYHVDASLPIEKPSSSFNVMSMAIARTRLQANEALLFVSTFFHHNVEILEKYPTEEKPDRWQERSSRKTEEDWPKENCGSILPHFKETFSRSEHLLRFGTSWMDRKSGLSLGYILVSLPRSK